MKDAELQLCDKRIKDLRKYIVSREFDASGEDHKEAIYASIEALNAMKFVLANFGKTVRMPEEERDRIQKRF